MTRAQLLGLGLSVALLAALLAAIHSTVGWNELLHFWQSANPHIALAAAGLLAVSHLIRAQRLYRLLPNTQAPYRWRRVLAISTWHTALNNLLPMRSGEVSLPILIRRRLGLNWTDGVVMLVIIRAMDVSALLLVWALSFMHDVMHAIAVVIVWLGLNLLVLSALPSLRKRLPAQWGLPSTEMQLDGTAQALVLTLLAWVAKFSGLLLLANAVMPQPASVWASAVLGGELSSISPVHGPAGLGSYEAAFIAPATLSGLNWADALAVGVNLHLFLLFTSLVMAGICQAISPSRHTAVTER